MASEETREITSAGHAPEGATATAPPPRPAPEKRRTVVKATRPYFFTPTGERVELPPESLDAQPGAVDPELVDALDAGAAPAVPTGGAMGVGPAPIAPDARPIYAGDGREVFLSPGAAVRVGSRPGEAPAPAPPPAVAPAPPEPPRPAAEPVAEASAPAPAPQEREGIPAGYRPRGEGAFSEGSGGEGGDELGRADAANVEIRSEEIDEILSTMPGGLVRWGITAVFGTLLVLLGISWYIAYPDVVSGRIALTTPTPPVRLVARTGGAVARVFAADGSHVRAGQPLVLLQNPADYAAVQALSAALDRLEPALQRGGAMPDLPPGGSLSLGALQSPYSTLQQAHSDYRLARDEVFYAQKLNAARQQVADLELMRRRLQAQQGLLEQQLRLSERSRERTRMLVERSLAAPADVDRAEEEYLQKRVALETGRTSLTSNEVQLSAQRAALLDLEQRRSDEGQRGLVGLRNATHALRAAVAAWEQDNVLRAPVDGTVSFFRDLHENQYAGVAEPLVAVVPTAQGLVGRVSLTGQGAGKVRVGQRVIIRFESYPYREFGTVEGRVRRVSQLGFQPDAHAPDVTTYQVEVTLPKGLVTSYGRSLGFRQEMRGDADVVTQDMRLIERLFNKIRSTASGG
jgi:multidrug resistance efflux pump